jgi:hypothetical protein
MGTFNNNNVGTGANDTKVFVSSLGVMTSGGAASTNMKKNNGAKAVGADLDYGDVDYDYANDETDSILLTDTNKVVLKDVRALAASSTWENLVPKQKETFIYNGGISGGISEAAAEGNTNKYRVYVENGVQPGYQSGDTLITDGVSESIANELVRQQKAYIIGGNVLEARGSSSEYTSEKIVVTEEPDNQSEE